MQNFLIFLDSASHFLAKSGDSRQLARNDG
jgi:hypothetical protein